MPKYLCQAVYSVFQIIFRLRNDLYCDKWGVKLYSLTHPFQIIVVTTGKAQIVIADSLTDSTKQLVASDWTVHRTDSSARRATDATRLAIKRNVDRSAKWNTRTFNNAAANSCVASDTSSPFTFIIWSPGAKRPSDSATPPRTWH